MKRFIEKRYMVRQHILPLIAVSLTFYFAYHLMQGQRSYPRLMALQNQIETMDLDLAQLKSHRAALESKVVMMRPGSVNYDLVMEQARKVLGYRFNAEMDYIFKD